MKRFVSAALLIALLFSLAACGKAARTDEYEEFCRDKTFIDDLPEEDLTKPERVLKSLDDFIYALDYLAFYRVSDAVYFEFDETYAKSFYNPYTEFQKAYRAADLADVYACRLDDAYYSEYGVAAVKYSMSRDIATSAPASLPDTPIVPSFDYAPEGAAELVIPLEASEKPAVSCENGEQLYYLAMNGYRPVPSAGSVAEEIYSIAREVLRTRICADMTDFQKIRAIYDYLTTEIYYDGETAYSSETYLVREQAYYLEGVFFNRCAVCDGKAKAYALLLNMLGIPCYRTTGVSGEADHAWDIVELNGKWYVSCTTYGQANASETLGCILPNYSMLLAGRETPYGDGWGYTPDKHADVYALVEAEPYDVYGEMGEAAGVPLVVTAASEIPAMLEGAAAFRAPSYKIEFLYDGQDGEAFQTQMIGYLNELPGVNAMEIKSERGRAYQVICLKEN